MIMTMITVMHTNLISDRKTIDEDDFYNDMMMMMMMMTNCCEDCNNFT